MTDIKSLHSQAQLAARVAAIGQQISFDYAGKTLDIVYLINGGSMLAADLMRSLTVPLRAFPLGFSSYAPPSPTGEVRVTLDVPEPLHGRHVLVVEGIVVSGRTPKYIMDMLRLRQPGSLEMCAIGVKTKAFKADLTVKYRGFDFGDEVVIGYGVGEGSEKALPYIGTR
jgi:hypoxanthine phosphoribosyltransferase